jgi:hypothetical protein
MWEEWAMTITLTPDIEKAVIERANEQNTSPETIVLDALRAKFRSDPVRDVKELEPRDEWEALLLSIGTPCGVSPSDEALSSEGLYD